MSIHEDIQELYKQCKYLTGSFHRKPAHAIVLKHGTAALPELLTDLARSEEDTALNPLVISSVISTIVGKDRPTLLRIENAGKYDPVRNMWLSWAKEKGYLI